MAEPVSAGNNKFIVCQYRDNIATIGLWSHRNPMNYQVPLLLLQLSVISLTSLLFDFCLQPLGQSTIVSQILGGILFGPSILGNDAIMNHALFPPRSVMTLETFSVFGLIFFLFMIGIRTDPFAMIRPGKAAAIIGTSVMSITLLLTIALALLLRAVISMDDSLANALPYIAAAQSLTAFPNISCLLAELKMSSTDMGRVASSASMFCDILGMALVAISLILLQSNRHPVPAVLSVSSIVVLVLLLCVFIPIVRRGVRKIPNGRRLGEHHVFACFIGVLLAALVSEVVGQHYVFGALLFGLLVPEGPPLGSAVAARLDFPAGKILYPTFLTASGLKTNIFKIKLQSLGIVVFLVLFSCIVKVGSTVVVGRFLNIQLQNSFVIGLILNARGACELIMFNLWRDNQILPDQEFALCVITLVGVVAIITPLIKTLYDPSKEHAPFKKRTIQHSKRDAELRILVCIQTQDNVPSMVNLLEASHPTEESPIAVIALLLEELVGRAAPMLVAHQSTRALQTSNSKTAQIINALRQYEFCNETCVTMLSFSAISHMQMMHDDICRVALDQNATIIILPFHKRWEIDGSIGSVSRATRNMNIKVMEKSPCSVGILIDRGILTGSLSILNNQSVYRVAVIYIGGPDDQESLCYGARMAIHSNVTLTIFRFLLFGCDNAKERKQDNNLIDEVREGNIGNENFVYQEQIVKDGVGLASSIRALESNYDLLIVGKHHPPSPILMGLGAWSECPELGEVGDILASTDFGGTSSVLVVQQQRLVRENVKNRMMKPVVISHESAHDRASFSGHVASSPAIRNMDHDPSWEISIHRDGD